jgi:hypothetical protein
MRKIKQPALKLTSRGFRVNGCNLNLKEVAVKSFCALGSLAIFGLIFSAPAAAQFGARSGALGGSFTSRGLTRPLGGITPGFTGLTPNRNLSNRNNAFRRPLVGFPFAYSVWVPDAFDYMSYQNEYAAPYYGAQGYGAPQAAPAYYAQPPVAAPQQPVIINQYFGAKDSKDSGGPASNTSNTQAPGGPIGTPQTYYLIAYKNHQIYPALAYWVEDKTLHYVTTENTHNQASLDLIDITLSKSLNQGREVPFSIPGQQ